MVWTLDRLRNFDFYWLIIFIPLTINLFILIWVKRLKILLFSSKTFKTVERSIELNRFSLIFQILASMHFKSELSILVASDHPDVSIFWEYWGVLLSAVHFIDSYIKCCLKRGKIRLGIKSLIQILSINVIIWLIKLIGILLI
jgi:hypothetical protein